MPKPLNNTRRAYQDQLQNFDANWGAVATALQQDQTAVQNAQKALDDANASLPTHESRVATRSFGTRRRACARPRHRLSVGRSPSRRRDAGAQRPAAAASPSPAPARAAASAVASAVPSPSPVAGVSLGTALTGEFAITANMDDRTLSVVPIGLAQALPPIQLDIAPQSVASWMNTSRVVAADGSAGAHTLSNLDLASPQSATDIDVGGSVHVFSANGGESSALVVVSDSDNTLRSLDPTSGALGKSVQLGTGPHAVAFAGATATSPAQIYVSNAADGSVSVLDGGATTVQNTLNVGGAPIGIAVVPTNRLWIADGTANDVYEFDPARGPAGSPIDVGGGLKAESSTSDGHYLLLASSDADHALYTVDLFKVAIGQAASAVSSLAVPSGVLALATGAEVTLAYATTGDNHLVYWDLVNNALAQSVAVGNNPEGLALGLSMPNNTIAPEAMVGGGTVGASSSTGSGGGGGTGAAGGGTTAAGTSTTTGTGTSGTTTGTTSGTTAGAGAPSSSVSSATTGTGVTTTGAATTTGGVTSASSSAPGAGTSAGASTSSGAAPGSIGSNASTGSGAAPSIANSGSSGGTSSGTAGGTSSGSSAAGGSSASGSSPGISTIGSLGNAGGGSAGSAGANSGGIGASTSSTGGGVTSSAGSSNSSGTGGATGATGVGSGSSGIGSSLSSSTTTGGGAGGSTTTGSTSGGSGGTGSGGTGSAGGASTGGGSTGGGGGSTGGGGAPTNATPTPAARPGHIHAQPRRGAYSGAVTRREPTPLARVNVGGGGAGTSARSAGVRAWRRRISSRRLCSPRAIAQRWFAAKMGLKTNEPKRSNGLSARTRQSYSTSANAPSCHNVHTPRPARSPQASRLKPWGGCRSVTWNFQRSV